MEAEAGVEKSDNLERSGGSGSADMVTIKKKNLGTSDILGVFKVRDDAATMSSYQLPPQRVELPLSGDSSPR